MKNKNKIKPIPLRAIVASTVALWLLCLSACSWGETTSHTAPSSTRITEAGTITVVGTGSVEVVADVVFVDLAIVTDDELATRALSSNNKQMREVFKVLEKNNILKTGNVTVGDVAGHFQTKRFQITRKYKYNAQSVRVPAGWIVTNQITIELEETEKLASLLSELSGVETSSDLNINGVSYGVKRQEGALTVARKLAVLNAIKKANLLAKTAGSTLGKPKSITEARVYIPNTRNIGIAAFKSGEGSVPVTEGQQKISVTVTMVFSIEGN